MGIITYFVIIYIFFLFFQQNMLYCFLIKKGEFMEKIFEFNQLIRSTFISRINRYVVELQLDDASTILAHLHDPGRLTELLFENNVILIHHITSDTRKTAYDVIAAQKGDLWVLIHSGYHRKIAESFFNFRELLPYQNITHIKAEVKVGASRLDFLFTTDKEEIYIEQKGCSLEINGVATFPDAPTLRGTKHLQELIHLRQNAIRSAIFIFVFLSANHFEPNVATDPKFAATLHQAVELGVELHLFQFTLLYNDSTRTATLYYLDKIPYILKTPL